MEIVTLKEAECIIHFSAGVFVFDLALLPSESVTEKEQADITEGCIQPSYKSLEPLHGVRSA